MKTRSGLALLAALVATTTAHGQGSLVIIKQRARELSNQNNVRQGVPSPAQPLPAAPAATAAPARPLTAAELAVARLRADLIALKPDAPPSLALKQKLARDLLGDVQGPNKPSQTAANRLAEGLASALSERLLSATTRERLLQDVNAVLNPEKLSAARLTDITADIQAIFQANNFERKQAAAIADNAKALAQEIQKPSALAR